MTEGDIPNQKRLSYKEFLEICWGDYKPQDASLYQLLFRRLCARGFLEPDGEIPYPAEPPMLVLPAQQISPLEDRLQKAESRIRALEKKQLRREK